MAAVNDHRYISEESYWILMHHEVFQARYYGDAAGIEDVEDLITQFADSPHYDACVRFCERYDMTSFDPDYDTEPLEVFGPPPPWGPALYGEGGVGGGIPE